MSHAPTIDDVLKLADDELQLLRELQSDEEREDILAGVPVRFAGCVRFRDVWVQHANPIGVNEPHDDTSPQPRAVADDAPETVVSVGHE